MVVVSATSSAAGAPVPIRTLDDLPVDAAKLYENACPADYWASGRREFDGSEAARFSDGTNAYLMVCGSAASVIPFEVIVVLPNGAPTEALFHWSLKGRNVGASGLANAHFGSAPDTVVTSSHSSASCEPEYTHHWSGTAFDLIRLDRKGCRPGE